MSSCLLPLPCDAGERRPYWPSCRVSCAQESGAGFLKTCKVSLPHNNHQAMEQQEQMISRFQGHYKGLPIFQGQSSVCL